MTPDESRAVALLAQTNRHRFRNITSWRQLTPTQQQHATRLFTTRFGQPPTHG